MAAADPWTDLVPGPATPCPGCPPAPGAATPRATLALDHRRCRHSSAPLMTVGHCQRFGTVDFSRRDLLGMMDFSRWMSRSDLVAELGGSRATASPCAQGKERAVETGISGRCWLRLSLEVFETRAAAIPGDRTLGLGQVAHSAGGRSALCHSPAGSWRPASLEMYPKEERKNTHPSPASLKKSLLL